MIDDLREGGCVFDGIWANSLGKYKCEKEGEERLPLGKFTALVGATNSGKSRLLRALFAVDRRELLWGHTAEMLELRGLLLTLQEVVPVGVNEHGFNGAEIAALLNPKALTIDRRLKAFSTVREMIVSDQGLRSNRIRHYDVQDALGTRSEALQKLDRAIDSLANLPNLVYLPIMRGLRPLGGEVDLYQSRTVQDYFAGSKKIDINTGFELYASLKRLLLGKPAGRKLVYDYEQALSRVFFGGQQVSLIPEHDSDTVAVKIGDEEQFPIAHLGDGLQQVIIITAAAFLIENPSLFFIEEPETFLHPGLLRQLVQFLMSIKAHQFICTTHSNHVLDLAEMSDGFVVVRVTKEVIQDGVVFRVRECKAEREILLDLGVHPSSLYLANSTIWVEGITDRLYIRQYLRKYIETYPGSAYGRFSENVHYTFVEYQGAVLGHWDFKSDGPPPDDDCGLSALRLCSSAFLVADGDISSKGNRLANLKAQLGERLHLIPGKEIENLLPKEVLLEAARREFARRRAKPRELSVADLDSLHKKGVSPSVGVGRSLDKALGLSRGERFFAESSGTVSDKVRFCQTAIEVMRTESWELTSELTALCEAIFLHIEASNPKI